jgi:toxin ParE1/3/4
MYCQTTPEADRDLDSLADYYAVRENIDLALRFLRSAQETFNFLVEHPQTGWRCRWVNRVLAGTRVFPIQGFKKLLVFYRIDGDRLLIIRVLHGSRDIEKIFESISGN